MAEVLSYNETVLQQPEAAPVYSYGTVGTVTMLPTQTLYYTYGPNGELVPKAAPGETVTYAAPTTDDTAKAEEAPKVMKRKQ